MWFDYNFYFFQTGILHFISGGILQDSVVGLSYKDSRQKPVIPYERYNIHGYSSKFLANQYYSTVVTKKYSMHKGFVINEKPNAFLLPALRISGCLRGKFTNFMMVIVRFEKNRLFEKKAKLKIRF